jgi:hypothetical protein
VRRCQELLLSASVGSLLLVELVDRSSDSAVTASVPPRTREGIIPSCAAANSVEPVGTLFRISPRITIVPDDRYTDVSESAAPFSNNSPFVCTLDITADSTGLSDMLVDRHGELVGVENFVVVDIEDDVIESVTHESVPATRRLEGIADHNGDVTIFADDSPTIVVVLADLVHVEPGSESWR